MWKQISLEEAIAVLVAGQSVNIGFYNWGGTLRLNRPQHWAKARKLRKLTRSLQREGRGADGWWIYVR